MNRTTTTEGTTTQPTADQLINITLDAIELELRRAAMTDEQAEIRDLMDEPAIYRTAHEIAENAIAVFWDEFHFADDDSRRWLNTIHEIHNQAFAFVKRARVEGI